MDKPIVDSLAEGLTATPFEADNAAKGTEHRSSKLRGAKREAIKTSTYGLMHFVVAVLVAFALTGDVAIALSIGLIEPIVQTIAYVFHERGWAKAAGAPRTLVKMSTYAVMHFCVAVLTAFALTGDIVVALSIGLVEPLVQTVAYALHERGWARNNRPKTLEGQAA